MAGSRQTVRRFRSLLFSVQEDSIFESILTLKIRSGKYFERIHWIG
jgi:hypothetical protein